MDESILPEDDSVFEGINVQEESIASNALIDDSFASFMEDNPVSSTPTRRGRGRGRGRGTRGSGRGGRTSNSRSQGNVAASTSSGRGGQSGSDRLPCPECSNTYANQKTLATHRKMHAMKGVFARAPKKDDLKQMTCTLLCASLEEIQNEENLSELSQKLINACRQLEETLKSGDASVISDFLGESFFDIVHSQNVLLPSAMRSAMYVKTNQLLCSVEFRQKFKDELHKLVNASDEILNLLVGNVMLKLSGKILVKVLSHMRSGSAQVGNNSQNKKSKDSTDSIHYLQTAYYIGGSVVSGFMSKGKNPKSGGPSHASSVYGEVLRCKFLRNTVLGNDVIPSVSSFTKEKDRGGLKYLNQQAFDFFLTVFDQLMSLEGDDGSLPPQEVDVNVVQNMAVLCLWDDLVGSDLNEEQSLDLLDQVVHCCARIVVKGILNRRLNEELQQAYSSVTLRARLAR